jgi:hypothetical protein
MHTSIPASRWASWTGTAALVLSFVLVAACDTGGADSESGPPVADTSTALSLSVTVQSDTLALPGRLLVPDTSAAVPGVVLVHGSGAVDRNGQVAGTNLPPILRRWAERMAQRGIAVLRYDKRTTRPEAQAHPRALTFLDLVRDAVAAGRLLRDREAVDGDRVVFVGHSQGGNVAPAAATRLGDAAGVAALAGPALAADSLVVAQLEADPGVPDSLVRAAQAQFDSLRAGTPPPDGLVEIGRSAASVSFWRQWIRHTEHLDSVAAALDPPIFAQQGRADGRYPGETLARSLAAWRRVAGTDDASVTTYDGVDHYFLEDGTTTTADAPLDDLIAWIQDR